MNNTDNKIVIKVNNNDNDSDKIHNVLKNN